MQEEHGTNMKLLGFPLANSLCPFLSTLMGLHPVLIPTSK